VALLRSAQGALFTEGACYRAQIAVNVGSATRNKEKYENVPVPSADRGGVPGRGLRAALQYYIEQ